MPSRMASRIPPKFGFGGRRGLRIAIAQTVASANAPHCTAIARLGPNASINWPPSAGPLTIPVAQTVESSPWARPNCAGPTICAIAPKAAASANVRAMPIAKATPSTSHSGVAPEIAQSGTASAHTVWVECAAMMTRLRLRRSPATPAKSPKSTYGTSPKTATSPAVDASPPASSTSHGSATRPMPAPNESHSCAASSRRPSPLWRSPCGAVTRRARAERAAGRGRSRALRSRRRPSARSPRRPGG